MEKDENQHRLIETLRRRLHVLELQRAGLGDLHAPAHIITEIEDIERKLAVLQAPAPTTHPAGPGALRRRTNLSLHPADPFVGRARELEEIARGLAGTRRCLGLHGLGGMGKTALAEAAGRIQHERACHPAGVWLIELRNITTAAQARARIAAILELDPRTSGEDAALAAALRDWDALLILDDLDALRADDQTGLAALLKALLGTRALRLLVTARRALPGQVTHQPIELGRLEDQDALAAFHDYAPPPDRWGAWQPADLDALMAFLDGYPFPIRLAATFMARTRRSLLELRQALEANPRGTLRYPGDDEDRATSLAATLDLSYHALPEDARATLPLLALFPAGLTRAAARAILGEPSEVALETLLQHSMAEWREESGHARFALPEPARRYAEALQPPGALEQYGPPALAFFYDLIEVGNNLLLKRKELEVQLVLTLEQPNLRRFLDWGYEHEQRDDGVSLSARTTANLLNYWVITAAFARDEILQRLQHALEAARHNKDQLGEANVQKAIGDMQHFRDDRDAALESYEAALRLYHAAGSKLGEANAQKAIGDVQHFRDDQVAALKRYRQALTLYRAVSDRLGEANVRKAIGDVQQFCDEYDAALKSYQQALTLYRAVGDRLGEANVRKAIGDVQQFCDKYDAALKSYQQALTLCRAVGDRLGEAKVLAAQGQLALIGDDQARAEDLLARAVAIYQAIGSHYNIPATIGNYAWALKRIGQLERARPYHLRAAESFAAIGFNDHAEEHRRAAEDQGNPEQAA